MRYSPRDEQKEQQSQKRRRGIGQALLEKRLDSLNQKGYPLVTTTILASNHPSLGNVDKQGFEVFDRYTLWEAPLPLEQKPVETAVSLTSRPVQPADKAVFKALEGQISEPAWLQVQGSALSTYFVPFGERLLNQLTGARRWTRAFIKGESVIGFLTAATSAGQTKGTLARPVVADQHLECLPAMLSEAATWLNELGKTAVQIAAPDERKQMAAQLERAGWVQHQSWLRLVKWLK